MKKVQSWGRISNDLHNVVYLKTGQSLKNIKDKKIPHGMGRSYGDECLNPNKTLLNTTLMDSFISFDNKTGVLKCESGVLLSQIQDIIVPQGWMLPVTPGTELITIGGAVANDVHGKNYNKYGSFGHHIKSFILIRSNGDEIECSANKNNGYFIATIGGMGLTGLITNVEIKCRKIPSSYINSKNIAQEDLNHFFELSSNSNDEYNVSWIDCLSSNIGRGIFSIGNHCDDNDFNLNKKSEKSFPFEPPISLVNKLTLKPFNWLYYRLQSRKTNISRSDYKSFLYPLDSITNWNVMYGKKGFYQYQSVIPAKFTNDATTEMLKVIKNNGDGSFLAVLKTFGNKKPVGLMSFPINGTTLALDFANKGDYTKKIFKTLDDIVMESGGRIYNAKDSLQSKKLFEAGYPNLNEFLKYRDKGFSSALSKRLIGE